MISVAMAVYNGEKYLKDQLDSILNQTTPVDEIVIVDDKSTDATTDIIREYQLKNPQIRLFLNDKNIGYRENFRKAVSLCHGELTFCAIRTTGGIQRKSKLCPELWKMIKL